MTRIVALAAAAVVAAVVVSPTTSTSKSGTSALANVVVLLRGQPLAYAPARRSALVRDQARFVRELHRSVPSARVGWRYRVVANGFSLSLPASEIARVRRLGGVAQVVPAASYGAQADASPADIGAPELWGPTLDSAGQGVKIGIIDSGIDAQHPYFDPSGYSPPPGFPKGQRQFTTAKVIVARSFPPRGDTSPAARLAYTNDDDAHGTHVAGIAAGNAGTKVGSRTISGVAPRAYLGNYKVFVPTSSGLSPNANSPAIVAAIEAAVAAGNDYAEYGGGSVSSPATSREAIAAGALDVTEPGRRLQAPFSSVGPTTISQRLKPDVMAPGVDVLSSVPSGWESLSGTSMASPYVAGAAALLVQRHPAWTPAQVKSALVQSATEATKPRDRALTPLIQGGGVVSLQRADAPLVFSSPTALSLGLVQSGTTSSRSVALTAPVASAGTWNVAVVSRGSVPGAHLTVAPTVEIPGALDVSLDTIARAAPGDVDGYVELRRGTSVRRIPYWGRVTRGRLARHRVVLLRRPGLVRGTTKGANALVSRYRYPDYPRPLGVTTVLRGPERLYVLRLRKRVANFGAVLVRRGTGSRVELRSVADREESRLTGYAALPLVRNPYLGQFQDLVPAVGALSPAPGEYAFVVDSATRASAGSFAFRWWVDDVKPPVVRMKSRKVRRGVPLTAFASDSGSGVYPASLDVRVDGDEVSVRFRNGAVSISTAALEPGTHRVRIRVSDYQETKNTENVARVLPNTRTLTTTFRVV
jgi:subtilisin family serine protease